MNPKIKSSHDEEIENVVIVGSGPAGLTAAVYSSRALLRPLLFEGDVPGGQLTTTTDVENYPGFPDGITGPELIEVCKKQAERFGTRILSTHITKVDLSERPFRLWAGPKMYRSRSIIISTGATAKYLGLESEKKFFGKGVSACATCDGAFFKGVDVAVVGGGDTAMEESLFLTRFAKKVIVLHRRDAFRASKIMAQKVIHHPKIEVMWNSEVIDVLGGQLVESLKVRSTINQEISELKVEGLFVAIGHKPNSDVFKGLLEMNALGYIMTKPHSTKTSVEGVFAAGDVQDHVYRQAVTAAGTGCMAAIDAERWLEAQSQI